MIKIIGGLLCSLTFTGLFAQSPAREQHRPLYHFTPKAHWMNDPNGMVFVNGVYHLFFQYYPEGTTWGPMHWGHATSKDMVDWEEQPIALYPDSLGWIFSGSAVVDSNNTSGLGKDGKIPLVAIFTHHNQPLEKQKRTDFQYQSIAYSLDEGRTWTKYEGNPVLKNPGIVDFRDPKVRWHAPSNKWIMTLATKDRITFYASPDLKNWQKQSEFGEKLGAHGGVWECPDLLSFDYNGKTIWVLLVSINPGAPNGGSGTQYFVGDFDGKTFTPIDNETRWMDYGTDNYAGVTFSNTGNRNILIGWMSNWQYAQAVPTKTWRSATTLPRELSLKDVNGKTLLVSKPVKELKDLFKPVISGKRVKAADSLNFSGSTDNQSGAFLLELKEIPRSDFSIVLGNDLGDELVVGYETASDSYFIDRRGAGQVDFEPGFARRHLGKRLSANSKINLCLYADVSSVELFADDGLTVMTVLFFPRTVMNKLTIRSVNGLDIGGLSYYKL